MSPDLSVREIQHADIPLLLNYWYNADADYLKTMGADINLLPGKDQWTEALAEQVETPYAKKQSYCIIWLMDNQPVGHSNTNKIKFGEEAFMHLHLWDGPVRGKGIGTSFVKMTIPYFFNNLQLKKLFCEPYALNPAPNKTLAKAGFHFVTEQVTIPGSINFEQPTKLWEMTYKDYEKNTLQ